jgi:hypothetical protein
MASDDVGSVLEQFYATDELVELWRDNLRHARSSPPGAQRNQHRKLARSLRVFFKTDTSSTEWLPASTKTN